MKLFSPTTNGSYKLSRYAQESLKVQQALVVPALNFVGPTWAGASTIVARIDYTMSRSFAIKIPVTVLGTVVGSNYSYVFYNPDNGLYYGMEVRGISEPEVRLVQLTSTRKVSTFCAAVKWVSGGEVYRYKLWEGVSENVDYPVYAGEIIPASFRLEIWNVEDTNTVVLSAESYIPTSILEEPTSFPSDQGTLVNGTFCSPWYPTVYSPGSLDDYITKCA